jgi:ATP diphosphatase
MAQEQGVFEFDDVVRSLNAKLVRRHPHVFGDARGLTSGGVEEMWEQIKSKEREEKDARRGAVSHKQKEKMAADDARADGARSVLAGISVALPALTRACKLQARAAKVGFDWNDWRPVLAKIREEANEIEGALASGDSDEAAAEVGDLLFAVTNLARHLGIDPEAALRGTNRKFERRFAAVEAALSRRGKAPQQSTLAEMDELWNEAKLAEREQRTNAAE